MVLFGGTGDLAMRKLLPALYRRHAAGQLPRDARILGVARAQLAREDWIEQVEASCQRQLASGEFAAGVWSAFSERLTYLSVDATRADQFHALQEALAGREHLLRVFFLSMSPALFTAACSNLGASGLITPLSRVVLEKPLGHDGATAHEINCQVGALFPEHNIYRIDHYLGKETVQNLFALRFGNALFEPLWRRGLIRYVQITVAEQLGVEGRGQFYDDTGAMRDMVQNHLLQLLSILAMEPPASRTPDAIRDEKLKVLRALRPIAGRDAALNTIRGQYKAGASMGQPVPGYLDEPGVAADSTTETFVAIKAEIDTWRWAGVPFYLRTGKRLQEQVSEIVLTFEDIPFSIFDPAVMPISTPNRLMIRLQPEESITLTILAKNPGEVMQLKPVNLGLDLGETFKTRRFDAYERLLTDVVKGNLTLFMRHDELDAAWAWVDPIREAWIASGERPKAYTAGTTGPAAASALISRDGHAWYDES
jgi:glucose-6-phosphate 1-dehydrogenase